MVTIEKYLNLFRFRSDTFTSQNDDGSYTRVMRSPTMADLEKHLAHEVVLALYPSIKGHCMLGCIDFDIERDQFNDPEAWEECEEKVVAANQMFADLGVESLTERTGGRGYHIWVFSEIVSSSMMFRFLKQVTDAIMVEAEIFPIDSYGLGKAIRTPLGTHKRYKASSYFVDNSSLCEVELTNEMADHFDQTRITTEFMVSLGIRNVTESLNSFRSTVDYATIPKAADFDALLEEIRPCFRAVFEDGVETEHGQGWNFMTAAAVELLANGATDDHIHTYFSAQDQYSRKTTNKHLGPIKRKNLTPYRCSKLQEMCGNFVEEYCPDCPLNKQQRLNESIEQVVDRSQDKEKHESGDISATIDQFQFVATELNDVMDDNQYTLITNGFNSGKTWTTVGFLNHIVHTSGHRANFITPSNAVKAQMIDRLKRSKINFLDNPSNMALCPRSEEFKELGYVPSMMCNKCSMMVPIQHLIKPIMEDYIEAADESFFGDMEYFKEKAEYYCTCPKWVYLATLEATVEESMVLLMTHAKIKHHFFIPDSPLTPALSSPSTYCNVIDQIDFVNRNIPKITFSDKEVYRKMALLGMIVVEDFDDAVARISNVIESGDLEPTTLREIEALDYLKSWMHCQKMFDEGVYRRTNNVETPELYHYDFMGEKELSVVLNDVIMSKINPRLYDNVLQHISNVKVATYDGIERVPLNFKTILENVTECESCLGITSTPSELEMIDNHWLGRYNDEQTSTLKNLYSIPTNIKIDDKTVGDGSIIFSRKCEDGDYINDGQVRGNTGTGGHKDKVIIESLQYPNHSERLVADLVQLCGGNLGQGIRAFYQGIIADALTQANKYDCDKIIVPNPELFTLMGFEVKTYDDGLNLAYWTQKVKERFAGCSSKRPMYRDRLKAFDDDTLEMLIENDVLIQNGKKYILTEE